MTKGGDTRLFGRRRKQAEKEELRELILRTAGDLFVEWGYSAFSMRKLAEKLQYSPAALYVYFRSKDELLFTVVDHALQEFRRQLAEAAAETADPWERLERLGEAYLRFGFENPAHYQLMFMWRIDYLIGAAHDEELPRIHAFRVLADNVQDAMDQGALRVTDAQACSDYLWAAMHGVVALSIQMPMFDRERIGKLSLMMKEMIYRSLRA